MQINGRDIAQKIYQKLLDRVGELQKAGTTAQLAVVLIGDDPRSLAYIAQKQKRGSSINAKISVFHFAKNAATETIKKKISALNHDRTVHGILIQRPIPPQIDEQQLINTVDPKKDVDGFHPQSPFTLPLPLAVVRILEEIYNIQNDPAGFARNMQEASRKNNFLEWLNAQIIVIVGKGPIGGKPIIEYMKKLGLQPVSIDSKTENPKDIIRKADIIISAVGKKNIITPDMLKPGVILIGVGLFRGKDGKLHGDYDEATIKHIAGFYTPTPGGVGPVNIALLMDNVVTAAQTQSL